MPDITLATHTDIPALRRFFDEHWRRGHIMARDEALLRWQYGRGVPDAPADRLTMLLARDGDAIGGFLGFIPVRLQLTDGRCVAGAWLSHWLVIEAWRASGAGLQLLARLRQLGYEALAVLGINDTVKELYRRLGFTIIDDLPRYLAITHGGAAQSLATAAGLRLTPELLTAWQAPPMTVPASVSPLDLDANAKAVDSLPDLQPPGTRRDRDWLRWRYLRHPTFHYRLLIARHAGRATGLAAYRVETVRDRHEAILRVTDCFGSGPAIRDLACALTAIAQQQHAAFVDTYATCIDREALAKAGLRRLTPESPLAAWPSRFQPLDAGYTHLSGAVWAKAGNALIDPAHTYFSKADGDVDRPN